jgi:hypothetical protein
MALTKATLCAEVYINFWGKSKGPVLTSSLVEYRHHMVAWGREVKRFGEKSHLIRVIYIECNNKKDRNPVPEG